MDEATLWSKLRKIEALHAGTTSDGEREAACLADAKCSACSVDCPAGSAGKCRSVGLNSSHRRAPTPTLKA